MYIKRIAGLVVAALMFATPLVSAQVVVRRGTRTTPSTRVYTNVPGVGIVGYTDAETRWINQLDQTLGQYQQKNPYAIGSDEWLNYVDSLVAWYQEQNPYPYGTPNWTAYNNRITDWYLAQNPYPQGTPNFQTYASRITGEQAEQAPVYARPAPINREDYMREVYRTNPYAQGTPEWTEYNNNYINEYNRLYSSNEVTAEPVTPQTQQAAPQVQLPTVQPWVKERIIPGQTQPLRTQPVPGGQNPPLPMNWAQQPAVTPPTAYRHQNWMEQPGAVQPTVPQQNWTQQPWGAGAPTPQNMMPQGTTPMTSPGAVGGGTMGGVGSVGGAAGVR